MAFFGMSRIGTAIAKRAEAFNCSTSYSSKNEKPNYRYYPNLIDLASNCEIHIVACSLTEETQRIINRQVINALGPKGVFINIGRGLLVDEREPVSELLQGGIGGAGVDVFEHEPEVPEELFGLDNVVLLPHVASATVETRKEMADLVAANLKGNHW